MKRVAVRPRASLVTVLCLAAALVLAMGTVARAHAAGNPEEGQALAAGFQKGVAAYDTGDHDGAIAEWEKLLRFRVESAALEYDLANAYFKKKDYGRSVLHWERALRIEPGDRDAKANLELVRTLLVDDVRVETPPVTRAFETVAERVSLDDATKVVLVAWLVLGLGVLVAQLRDGGPRRLGIMAVLVSLVVLIAAVPLVVFERSRNEDRTRLVVLTPAIEVLSGPGAQHTNVFTVHEGLVVKNLESQQGWERVELPNGLNGWVPADAVERI